MENLHIIEQKLDFISVLLQELQTRHQRSILNLEEAAAYLGIAKSTLYKHTSEGNIAFYKPSGKLISFKREDLDKWIEAKRVPSNQELRNL